MPSCPICELPWPSQISVCPCGFSPSAIDGFVERLKLARRRGIARQALGLLLGAVTLPAVFVLGGIDGGMVLVPIVSAAFVVSGGVVLVRATQSVVQTTRRLRAVHELRRLPVARVVD